LTQWGSFGAGEGQFGNPRSVAADMSHNIYIGETYCGVIKKFTDAGTFLTEWGTCGYGLNLSVSGGIAADTRGAIYLAVPDLCRISKFDGLGGPVSEWGACVTNGGVFDLAYGVAVDGSGNVYVSDLGNRILKFGPTPTPSVRETWGHLKAIYR